MEVIRPLEWVFSWLSERPVVKAEARICTMPHLFIYVDGSGSIPKEDPHIDLKIHLHKRRGGKLSVYELDAAAEGQNLVPLMTWEPVEIEGGGKPVEATLTLMPPSGEPLLASEGDEVKVALLATHRRRPMRVSVKLEPETGA